MVAARLSIGAIFLFSGFYFIYANQISDKQDTVKRYKFSLVTKRYLNYEKEILLFEKYAKDKYII